MSTPPRTPGELQQDTAEREAAARRYVEQLRAFSVHASLYAVGILIMFAVNLFINLAAGSAGEWSAWWSAWAFLGWSIGIMVHGLVVWLNRPSFASSTWEQRKIEKLLEK